MEKEATGAEWSSATNKVSPLSRVNFWTSKCTWARPICVRKRSKSKDRANLFNVLNKSTSG
jgi:hypothetical protein